jgi:hypothetical protein
MRTGVNMLQWSLERSITVAARAKEWTVFALSNTGIVGSNTTQSMDVCMRLFCVRAVLCVGSGLATGWSPVQWVVPIVYKTKKLKKRPRPNKGSRAIDRDIMVPREPTEEKCSNEMLRKWTGNMHRSETVLVSICNINFWLMTWTSNTVQHYSVCLHIPALKEKKHVTLYNSFLWS